MRKKAYAVRYVAGQPDEIIFAPENSDPLTHCLPEGARLPVYKTLKVLVWNIFKQQRADWQSVLLGLGKESHLILLQEAQTTPELIAYATKHHISVEQVPALQFPQHPSGVMTLSGTSAVFCCPLHEREPLLRMAKSALITVYPLPDGRMLMVVNIHAVNFSFGIDIYRKQLAAVGEQMRIHQGPVMMGGDFNSWSRQRMNVLYTFIRDQSLKEVRFSQDFRRTAFGRPLDFIFYRGISIKNARVLKTDASDHNPLFAEFSFTESS